LRLAAASTSPAETREGSLERWGKSSGKPCKPLQKEKTNILLGCRETLLDVADPHIKAKDLLLGTMDKIALRDLVTDIEKLKDDNRTQAAEIDLLVGEKEKLSETIAHLEDDIQSKDSRSQQLENEIKALRAANTKLAERMQHMGDGYVTTHDFDGNLF
jgi:chromosome segregation ATPase